MKTALLIASSLIGSAAITVTGITVFHSVATPAHQVPILHPQEEIQLATPDPLHSGNPNPNEKPLVTLVLVKKPLPTMAPIAPKLTVQTSTPAVAPIVQDHCINIPGIQTSLPAGMAYDQNHNCVHIPTAEDAAQAQAVQQQLAAQAVQQAKADKQAQIDALTAQIAALEAKYASEDQSNTYLWHDYVNQHQALLDQRSALYEENRFKNNN